MNGFWNGIPVVTINGVAPWSEIAWLCQLEGVGLGRDSDLYYLETILLNSI